MASAKLHLIHCFPVKGFPGLAPQTVELEAGSGIPDDRRFAITLGIEPAGEWMPCQAHYRNSVYDGLQKFKLARSSYGAIELENPAGQRVRLEPGRANSIAQANAMLHEFMAHVEPAPGQPAPKIYELAGPIRNWDFPDTPISIINAATVREIASAIGMEMDPVRFRGNLVIDGLEPWEELGWMGARVRIGDAALDITRPIVRCPTPGVNPASGERDIRFAEIMPQLFGHAYCGMYARVAKSGKIAADDMIEIIGPSQTPIEQAVENAEDYRLWPRMVELTFCEIGTDATRISLKPTSPWPMPAATPGQRLRLHLGSERWTTEYVKATSPGHYHLEVAKSATGDLVTEHLRTGYKPGDRIVISGPFGKA